jgi:hypothetical protein
MWTYKQQLGSSSGTGTPASSSNIPSLDLLSKSSPPARLTDIHSIYAIHADRDCIAGPIAG